jgi:hypothetical protein
MADLDTDLQDEYDRPIKVAGDSRTTTADLDTDLEDEYGRPIKVIGVAS